MIELLNCDCMHYMKTLEDKAFDLAIVDPPYGIGVNKVTLGNGKRKIYRGSKDWDAFPPNEEYFSELFRVSENQIIWGANHFISKFSMDSSCWIFWDKGTGANDFADGELAWGSFDRTVRKYFQSWVGANAKDYYRIHPTVKPIELMRYLCRLITPPNGVVLDPFMGSGSTGVAAQREGFDFIGMELDSDYYEIAQARIGKASQRLQAVQAQKELCL